MRRIIVAGCLLLAAIFGAQANQSNLWSPTTGTVSGLQLTLNYNSAFSAMASCNSGNSAPTNEVSGNSVEGQCWLDTSSTPNTVKIFDSNLAGGTWLPIAYLDATNHIYTPIVGGGAVSAIASAATTDLCSVKPAYVEISGTTTITSFGSTCPTTGQVKWIRFQGALTLTHNASSLILPNGGLNITTAANDTAMAVNLGSGNWRVAFYVHANGTALVAVPNVLHSAKTTTYTATAADQGNWIDATSGTWTFTLPSPASVPTGWWIYFSNNGTGSVTITPAAGTIDTLSSFVSYPGEARIIESDGSNFQSIVLAPFNFVITATGATTFTVPPKYNSIGIMMCGAGGGGAGGARQSGNTSAGGGGGGGGYCWNQSFQPGALGSSQTVTIGTGGSAGAGSTSNNVGGAGGNAGGNSTFGSLLTAKGGAGGNGTSNFSQGGGGGGGGGPTFNAGNGVATTGTGSDSEFMAGAVQSINAAVVQGGCAGMNGLGNTYIGNMNTCGQGGAGGGGGGNSSGGGSTAGAQGSNSLMFGGPGGGGGGNVNGGGSAAGGGAGGQSPGCQTAPTGGATNGGNGGSTASSATYLPGCGGGGGGGNNGVGGTGGAGTNAGGGGGGGAGENANGGPGGAGGNGFAWLKGGV